jgi:hypothetical protein
MRIQIILIGFAVSTITHSAAALTIEETANCVPAELVGNEHMRWGFPGGDCDVLVNQHFVTCHNDA